jgi:hypothetical protein
MEPQEAPTARRRDRFLPAFSHLRSRAACVLNEHIDSRGLCAVCGSSWPRERVQLAEHNLAVL